jgi:signal transduction histidine kinase
MSLWQNIFLKNRDNSYILPAEMYNIQRAERERISADMHDELGSGITAIRLMSETAKKKIKEEVPAELEKISTMASDLLNNMNAIIWSMQASHDKLESLVRYLKIWTYEYFENTGIEVMFEADEVIPEKYIAGTTRRNIFLSVKEALTNILKHAGATRVCVRISINPVFKIRIADNGRGINLNQPRPYSQGIKNMKWRMGLCGGHCVITNEQGTVISLELD